MKQKLVIANFNINYLSNRFENFKAIFKNKVDILALAETKLDSTFSDNQFFMKVFRKPFCFDRTRNEGGVCIYVREGIPRKLLNRYRHQNDIEAIFIEIFLRETKWLVCGTYYPPTQKYDYELGKSVDLYSSIYNKFVLIGDFIAEKAESCLTQFLSNHYRSEDICRGINLFITNSLSSFQNTMSVTTGLSDCHKMVVTVSQKSFQKAKPWEVT